MLPRLNSAGAALRQTAFRCQLCPGKSSCSTFFGRSLPREWCFACPAQYAIRIVPAPSGLAPGRSGLTSFAKNITPADDQLIYFVIEIPFIALTAVIRKKFADFLVNIWSFRKKRCRISNCRRHDSGGVRPRPADAKPKSQIRSLKSEIRKHQRRNPPVFSIIFALVDEPTTTNPRDERGDRSSDPPSLTLRCRVFVEIERTNRNCARWPKSRNTLWQVSLESEVGKKWHLTTWTAFGD